jgi:2-oxoglutarate dehydrogenase complex dihydrolipoamide succinyltransferase (E2) component
VRAEAAANRKLAHLQKNQPRAGSLQLPTQNQRRKRSPSKKNRRRKLQLRQRRKRSLLHPHQAKISPHRKRMRRSQKPHLLVPEAAERLGYVFLLNPAEAQLLANTRQVKMNRMRLRIAERLKQSQNTAASLTTFNEVDMSSIIEFRKLYKEDVLKKTGVKLGFMSAFAKASVLAMKDIPAVNASIEGPGGGDTIVYRDYVDISVAVATPKGLVTPVVRNAESMDMIAIEQAIADLGKKARDGKLTIEDMAGGTFTISNGGVFGSMMGTPIINLPQTAVLGMHATKDRPVAINGKVEIRPVRNAMLWSKAWVYLNVLTVS